MKIPRSLWLALILLLAPAAFARVEFGATQFAAGQFRGIDKVEELCQAPAASSFWCSHLTDELTLITTKGADFFFDAAGELVAVFAKQQKGQSLGSYNLDSGQNLIPVRAPIPGGAVLLDGEYTPPTDASGSWQRVSDTELEGTFSYRLDGIEVEKRVLVSNITHTVSSWITATRPADVAADAERGGPTAVQYAFPGIARQEAPPVKIGQGDTFTLNPVSQPVPDASYVSVQTNNRNSGYAIVMRPAGTGEETRLSVDDAAGRAPALDQELAAQALPGSVIAMQATLPAEPGAEATLAVETYTGPNELVRYTQEGFADLPGLFRPNILGRMSLGIIWVLRYIHEFVPSWGLAIIVLTLLFRALIWPLISTQTKSMFGMQQLQPKIQALQKKYKNDREKLTQETMKLYKEAGVNPAGGCLPILLQMPLFIILWRVFVNFEFNEGFLWLPDLGQADPFYILPLLYVGVMVAQSYFATRGNQQQFRQQLFMNVIFVFIMVGFPAGVILYFVVSMLVQVVQYWLLSRNRPTPAPAK